MELHYIVVILLIAAILVLQWRIFRSTLGKIKAYRSTFLPVRMYKIEQCPLPRGNQGNGEAENGEAENGEEHMVETVAQLKVSSKDASPVLKEIFKSLNKYLIKNKGAVSDFHLMKDVVERNCEVVEEEINIQQPIPLYLGLMGTMIGIIVGIGFIAFSGGLDSDSLVDNISSLMTCVAIAMIASLVGISCTTFLSWKTKDANATVEAEKNLLYSWLQTELLPTLSGNAVNALFMLQQNLTTFNSTFQNNIKGLGEALSMVGNSSKAQAELLATIEKIDIKRAAEANVTVLKELRECTGELETFNKYLHNVSSYLESVNALNKNLTDHLDRTQVIEEMGKFFKNEIEAIDQRKQYINHAVASVDDTFKITLSKLEKSTNDGIDAFVASLVRNHNEMITHYAELRKIYHDELENERHEFSKRMSETTQIVEEMNKLSDVKEVMGNVLVASNKQSELLEKLLNSSVESRKKESLTIGNESTSTSVVPMAFPRSVKLMLGLILAFVIIFCGTYIFNTVRDIIYADVPVSQTEVVEMQDSVATQESDFNRTHQNAKTRTPIAQKQVDQYSQQDVTSKSTNALMN